MPPFFYRIVSFFAVGFFLHIGSVLGQDGVAYNTTPFDSLSPSPTGRYSALWGYTAPDGREYALLGGFTGTHIVDITTKPIREVAFIPGHNSGWREMKTYGNYAYVVSEGGGGLQIIDLTGLPLTATLVKSDSSVFRTGHTITQDGKWVYVNGSNLEAGANQGVLIFNIGDDPENPQYVGRYDRGYVHDCFVRNDTMYTAMINDGRLDVVYLGADRSAPELVTEIAYPGAGTHNAGVTLDGRYILTTDEVGETEKTLKIWDRSDINDIAKVVDWTADEDAIIHNVHIRGTVAYIAWYTAGTRIVDISNPEVPVEIGFYDMYPGTGKRYTGNWGVYPYFESGKIISSDMTNGLYVFTFDGAKKGIANGVVKDAVSGNPIPGAVVEFTSLGREEVTDANGAFELLAAEGNVTYNATAVNYTSASGVIFLSSDGSNVLIELQPLVLRDIRIRVFDDTSGEEISDFAYDVQTRGEGIAKTNAPAVLHLPADSEYTVRVGAWGWLPGEVNVSSDMQGQVDVRLKRGYADDAELDLGWSLGLPDDDGVNGSWERGVPVGVRFQFDNFDPVQVEPAADHTPGRGQKAFLTKIIDDPETAPGLADVDSGRVTLTSPQFDLSTYADPRITFSLWYSNDAIPVFTADDSLYVRLSNDGGQHWVDVLALDSGLVDWEEHTLRVADFLPPTAAMRFRVVASDSGEQGWTEAGLDDFRVTDTSTSGVVAAEAVAGAASIQVAPNPARTVAAATILSSKAERDVRLELFDLLGRSVAVLYHGPVRSGTKRIEVPVGSLSAGRYLLRLTLDDGATVTGNLDVVH